MSDQQAEQKQAAITPEHLAAADEILGRETSQEHRTLMLGLLEGRRAAMATLRASDLAEGQEPAILFHPLLPGIPAPARGTQNLVRMAEGALPEYDGDPRSLAFATVADLSRLLDARQVTARALTEMYLARLKEHGPRLHCVVNLVPDEIALAQAEEADREIAAGRRRGPLHGIPYGAKDLLATRGLPTTFGARPFEGQVLDHDAAVVARLEAAGAILLARACLTNGFDSHFVQMRIAASKQKASNMAARFS